MVDYEAPVAAPRLWQFRKTLLSRRVNASTVLKERDSKQDTTSWRCLSVACVPPQIIALTLRGRSVRGAQLESGRCSGHVRPMLGRRAVPAPTTLATLKKRDEYRASLLRHA